MTRHLRLRGRTPRTVVALVALGFLLAASAGAAFAVWSVPANYAATNYALAKAGALAAPTGPSAAANGSTAITVGWTPAVGQVSGAQYRVNRTSGPGSPVTVCTVAASTTSCQDTGLTGGSLYGYSISAVLGAWQSTGLSASATTDKSSQTIAFTSTAPSPASVGGSYTVSATATSGLTVAFSLDATSSGCTISGATVTFTAAGTCKVNANQAGNAQYLAAPQVQQSITVASSVAGMIFTSVTVNGTSTTPSCTGTIGTTWTCTVSGPNNAVVAGNVTFATSTGTPAVFSGTSSTVNVVQTGKNAGSGTVTIAGGQTTSSSAAVATKSGSNSARVTATFNSWTAVLIIN